MIEKIILAVIIFFSGVIITFFLNKKLNKKTIANIKTVTKSEVNDKIRKSINKTADKQIKDNNDIIKRAEEQIQKNKEVINNVKKNS